ncbi:MAG: response regulator [Gammaproteobacteria bacterium]|nr:response regulator [Gammaproteobacteria bacterium]
MSEPSERILFVDDQQEIIALIRRHVGTQYDCVYAESGAAALGLLDTAGPFAVVVADYSMPNMDGVTLLAEIRRRAPDTVPIMLTAFADLDIAIAALHEGNIFRFLRKPWDRHDLDRALSNALDHFHLVQSERRLRQQLADANHTLDTKVKELDELNRLLEYWVEFSPAVLYSADCGADAPRLTYVSKNFARLSGRERTEVIVDPALWERAIHPEDAPERARRLHDFVHGRAVEHALTYRIRHHNGAYRTILEAIRCIRNPQGKALELVGCWLDISPR